MRTYLVLFLFVLIGGLSVGTAEAQSQRKKCDNITKDEFRKKQKTFIIREAQLTSKEAAHFFPLYFELQDKKRLLTEDANAKRNKALRGKLDEKQYKSAVDQILNAHVDLEQLEREYVEKYRRFLTNKKIFNIMTAEIKFRKQLIKNVRQ